MQLVSFLKKRIKEIEELCKEAEEDEELLEAIEEDLKEVVREIKKQDFLLSFSGKFDKNSALLELTSGVGGRDAEDFVAILLRMYQRFAERKSFKTEIISISYGEAGGPDSRIGIKSCSLEVKGSYAFGFLKEESGSHRLVRQSPFSSASLRHTSFAQVEVFPVIENDKDITIKEDDLKIDTFRSSGPGGQHVNKRESAIRITHIPTGLVVASQNERLQGENKRTAMRILQSKIKKIEEEKREEQLEKEKGKNEGRSWGTQIRNYVLHPYKMIKDLKTGKETSNVEEVLDGNIDLLKNDFI